MPFLDSHRKGNGELAEAYREILRDYGNALLGSGASVLVVCGGDLDREVLLAEGLHEVVISNLDERMGEEQCAPYSWSYQDAENLTYSDGSFDVCVVHSGLHHCQVPHRAIAEMYRVARRAVILFEPLDGAFTRLGLRLGFGQRYETAAVFGNDLSQGGVRNSCIPNYVYRFSAGEIVKIVSTLAPHARPRIRFYYHLQFPWEQLRWRSNRVKYWLVRAVGWLLRGAHGVAPRIFSNVIVAVIAKPELPRDLQPWLQRRDG